MGQAHPALVPAPELIAAMEERGYTCVKRGSEDVDEGKILIALLFTGTPDHS